MAPVSPYSVLFAIDERIVEAVGFDDGEDRPEDLFERDACGGRNIGDYGWRDVVAALRRFDCVAAVEHGALFFADVEVVEHLAVGLLADDRAGVDVLRGVSGLELGDALLQPVAEDVVDVGRRLWRASRRSTSVR